MDETIYPPAFMVFKSYVSVRGLVPGEEEEWEEEECAQDWARVKCASKKAYGCGERGQQLVEGLSLYVRRCNFPDLTTFLSIGMSDEASGIIEAELGIRRRALDAAGDIKIAHRQVLVMLLIFRHHCLVRRSYYLAYDSTDASLHLIPYIPGELEATYTLAAVPERSAGLKLTVMAQMISPDHAERGRLCTCTLVPQGNTIPDSTASWQTKVYRFSELSRPFSADVAFSSQGKIFWGDLSRGVAFSDLLGKGCSRVDTDFISLPDEYQIEYWPKTDRKTDWRQTWVSRPRPEMSRTMGCVEDSIKFVCIDRQPGNVMVKVLSLDLDSHLWKEDKVSFCRWNDLWKQVIFLNEGREVEPLEPRYPVLMPDGTLILLLPRSMQGNYYICRLDMSRKSLHFFGQVHNCHALSAVILPSDFFPECYPPRPQTVLPSISTQKKLPNFLERMLSDVCLKKLPNTLMLERMLSDVYQKHLDAEQVVEHPGEEGPMCLLSDERIAV